ncbi:DUF2254 domain-containing protein [Aurantiacibacter xanthus]|uniref:DUF2254 domain-containing protein n=1 Tax=Aurantiacibacter xanthus TaxID=1784712 RepID=A0A3A1P0L1_9SPHN|nr:DUF2254 domain-containing protein [Aurantiacibacter xanthus]RIV80451.1 DUF2254 domain-containing protein [Aurantiacibacter xanthus]
MKADLRWFWARLTANYWFFPSLFAIGAAVLGFVCVAIDRSGLVEGLTDEKWLIAARPESASNMLQVIAGSMIGVASTVFSITIAAVAYASGTYGPRLLTNFMEDKGNQLSLATFIGTFVYALTVLHTVRGEDETPALGGAGDALPGFVPQLSLLVAYALMALSVGVLVYFLNHVPSAIRINKVLHDIGRRLLGMVRDDFPEQAAAEPSQARPSGEPLLAERTGYVQLIDFEEMLGVMREGGGSFALSVRTGDFVHPGMALGEICETEASDELAGQLRASFTFGFARTPEQDPQFLIDELVEIGLRALSPGINDPFTAITALHWLGAATAELGSRRLDKMLRDDGDDKDKACAIYPLPDDFAHYVKRGFGAISSAVATSPIATEVMFDTLRHCADALASPERRALLARQGSRLHDQAREALRGPDLAEVEVRYTKFARSFAD